MPKYENIAADIRRSIEDGALQPGEKLPTVVELCEIYAVSKITVKRALEHLAELGLVTSRRGSGTFVKETAGLPPSMLFTGHEDRAEGFTRQHEKRGDTVDSVVYDFQIKTPSEEIARYLSIDPEDFTYYIVRVRRSNGVPIVIEYTYMPIALIPGLKKSHLYGSIYSYIKGELGLKISSFHRTVRAIPATPEEAERLDCKPNDPLLELEQIGFLDSGTPFEYSRSRNVGDRYELHNITLA